MRKKKNGLKELRATDQVTIGKFRQKLDQANSYLNKYRAEIEFKDGELETALEKLMQA